MKEALKDKTGRTCEAYEKFKKDLTEKKREEITGLMREEVIE
jgi:hypothetical protein